MTLTGKQTNAGTNCTKAHRPIASVPRVQLFKDLWVNLLNMDLFSSTVFIIIFSIHMRELLDILRDDYTETLDMPVPARASHCAKYFFPGDEKSYHRLQSASGTESINRITGQEEGSLHDKQHKICPASLGPAINTHDFKNL